MLIDPSLSKNRFIEDIISLLNEKEKRYNQISGNK
jgi:hypothetical protein